MGSERAANPGATSAVAHSIQDKEDRACLLHCQNTLYVRVVVAAILHLPLKNSFRDYNREAKQIARGEQWVQQLWDIFVVGRAHVCVYAPKAILSHLPHPRMPFTRRNKKQKTGAKPEACLAQHRASPRVVLNLRSRTATNYTKGIVYCKESMRLKRYRCHFVSLILTSKLAIHGKGRSYESHTSRLQRK